MRLNTLLQRLVSVRPEEVMALFVSCAYFFLVLCAYYIIRPIRDEMVIANGVANIQWLILLTLVVLIAITPIFGWITSRFKTRDFMAYCSLFFASHLVIFYSLFDVEQRSVEVSRAFYVWVNVFNMFIVSLFWSFMNDVYSRTQSKRLFAFIAAGGTTGAICGPIITTSLVASVGLAPLLLISASVLATSVVCIFWLVQWRNPSIDLETKPQTSNSTPAESKGIRMQSSPIKGGAMDGILLIFKSPYLAAICLFILLYAMSITLVQIQQASIIEAIIDDPAQRTRLFSSIDLGVNVLALLFQLFLTSRIIQWLGFRATLVLIPLGITLGFMLMAVAPLLAVMISVEVFRRAGDYSIMKPAREMLFNVVGRAEKYKAKNFIDTAVLRGGNALSAIAYGGAQSLGILGATLAGVSIALGLMWVAVAYWLGGRFEQKRPKLKPINTDTLQ